MIGDRNASLWFPNVGDNGYYLLAPIKPGDDLQTQELKDLKMVISEAVRNLYINDGVSEEFQN